MPFSLKSSQSQREIFHRGPLATLSLNLMSFLGHILPALPCVTSILRMCLCADIDKMAFYNHSHHTYTHKRLVLSTFLILCQCFKYSNAAHCEPFLLNTPICLHGVCGMLAVIKVEDILSPDYRRKKNRAYYKYNKEYSDDGLFGYTVSSSKAVRHRYIIFVFMECSIVFIQ